MPWPRHPKHCPTHLPAPWSSVQACFMQEYSGLSTHWSPKGNKTDNAHGWPSPLSLCLPPSQGGHGRSYTSSYQTSTSKQCPEAPTAMPVSDSICASLPENSDLAAMKCHTNTQRTFRQGFKELPTLQVLHYKFYKKHQGLASSIKKVSTHCQDSSRVP